jgi:hypothetical protein
MDTWTCHVCGKERSDDRISVYTSVRYIGNIPVNQNVRYCNDDPACRNGAVIVNFMPSSTNVPESARLANG